jgi:hypothetical protein
MLFAIALRPRIDYDTIWSHVPLKYFADTMGYTTQPAKNAKD